MQRKGYGDALAKKHGQAKILAIVESYSLSCPQQQTETEINAVMHSLKNTVIRKYYTLRQEGYYHE
ncbi:hypothetical protein GCM10025791_32690 [Halioxenophilus aromaticivorans]|uniref:Uncharacterized protein n=1 Tax=Halioxenophilus aromaticivorans TaxID=1306992 RepID=A0AAV3U5C2_9ALTE